MSIIKRAGDLVYTFRFLKLLVTKFEDTEAFKLGIIDADGKRLKTYDIEKAGNRDAYNNNFTPFHRLVYNIKKLIAKAPGGSSKIGSYAAALYLLKETYNISEKDINKALQECGLDSSDILAEQSEWFLLEDKRLSPGIYRVRNNKCLNAALVEAVNANDKIRIDEKSYPVGDIFGLDVYEAVHMPTRQRVFVTLGEIFR
tara:strand:- start:230 stop:829 length:600 start_codon:yes stop_codon:yes gene_type:complete